MSKVVRLRCSLAFALLLPAYAFAQKATPQAQSSGNPSPIAPFQMPQSIGTSPQSIGLSPRSVGISPNSVPVAKPPAAHRSTSGTPAHRNRSAPGAFVAAPLFLPYVGDSVPAEAAAPDTSSGDTAALSEQLRQLSQQLQNLQDQLARSSQPATPDQPAVEEEPPPPAPAITVVLKSGQSFQTQNYAVIGNTFWDLSSEPARKIAVGAIDTAASQKATQANGAEFPAVSAPR
ncbi:MAG TPA: hypothetical protein VKX25_00835 [Bryobacteraceae bacterium]|jgi:hypothetical protein|nr:hypothetical protein [Bryobacteraceae bacterium]